MGQYLFNLLLGIDQFANVVLLGDPDETISGRLGRAHLSGKAKWFVKPSKIFVDKIFNMVDGQQNHCVDSVEHEDIPHSKELWSWQRG